MQKRILKFINIVLYCFGSLMLFYGFSILLPSLANGMKEIHKTLAIFLTYSLPILILLSNLSKYTFFNKRKTILIISTLILLISLYSIFVAFSSFLDFNNKFSFFFPFDLILLSLGGVAFSIYSLLSKKQQFVLNTESSNVNRTETIIFAVYLILSAYFMGEFFCNFDYLLFLSTDLLSTIEIVIMFILFISMAIGVLLVEIFKKKSADIKLKFTTIYLLIFSLISALYVVILCVNPYIFAQSMQSLLLVGMLAKFPLGILIIVLLNIITGILYIKSNKSNKI